MPCGVCCHFAGDYFKADAVNRQQSSPTNFERPYSNTSIGIDRRHGGVIRLPAERVNALTGESTPEWIAVTVLLQKPDEHRTISRTRGKNQPQSIGSPLIKNRERACIAWRSVFDCRSHCSSQRQRPQPFMALSSCYRSPDKTTSHQTCPASAGFFIAVEPWHHRLPGELTKITFKTQVMS